MDIAGIRLSWKYTEDYYKQYTHDTWNESAPYYTPVLKNLDKYTPALLAAATPRPGDSVLDVATGPGEPACTIGPLVGEEGSVLGFDLSEKMIEIARERARELQRPNVRFEVMDAENLDLQDGSFDLAVCRFGLQIVTDPEKCMAEAHRVLRKGGRFAATVWGPGERVPSIHAIIEPMLKHATPDETGYIPTPYEMGGPGELVAILERAGFARCEERRVTLDWTFRDEEQYMDSVLKGTPIGHSLGEEDEAVQKQVLRETRENLKRWKTAGGIVMPSEAVVVSAVK
ncbi:MAG TPA: methyltransferase domain-containing protein [Thermoplasmata archaeon]|nr:methyltransferase domain-containing protein [Thermoplasmata archaeon]